MANAPSGLKGNPASTRMSNKARAARRERCWLRGQKRKIAREDDRFEREAENRARRELGEATPWEISKARRNAKRHG